MLSARGARLICALRLGMLRFALLLFSCAALSCGARTSLGGPSSEGPDAGPGAGPDAEGSDSSVSLAHACVLLSGALDTLQGKTWIWNGSGWSRAAPASAPASRVGAAAATLHGQVVLFGGYAIVPNGSTYVNDTWVWDGSEWTEQHPSTAPAPRESAAVATLGDRVVLFGGASPSETMGDTWEWDGTSWTEMHPPTSPPARRDAAAANVNGRVVVFGGITGELASAKVVGDTWEWDGSTWAQLSPQASPSARDASMAATVGGRFILFGGRTEQGPQVTPSWQMLDETWSWDGSNWTQLAPSVSPPPRILGSVGSLGSTMVLFGGLSREQLGDTWTWTGTTWNEASAAGPSARDSEGPMSCY